MKPRQSQNLKISTNSTKNAQRFQKISPVGRRTVARGGLAAVLSIFIIAILPAQTTSDNFEDGDLLNPGWFGDTGDFMVSDGRLRLMADGAGESVLNLRLPPSRNTQADSFRLEFLVDMDFAPSASNFSKIDLYRESSIGGISQTGAFLQLGGITGDQDALTGSIFEGDVGSGSFDGTPGALGQSPAIARLMITFNPENGYQFFADYTGGRDFQLEGTIPVLSDLRFDLLRITCVYTASRSDKFSFDDLNYQVFLPADETAPTLANAFVIDEDEVVLRFSERLADVPTDDPNNYATSLTGNSIASATPSGTTVRLRFTQPFPLREDFTVTVSRSVDEAGNEANNLVANLRYDPTVAPRPGNLVITEFMADPSPQVGLPNAEYIEIHNPTDTSVNLEGIMIASGGTPVEFSGVASLEPGAYIVLVDMDDVADFQALSIPILAINGLPSLTNGGDEIALSYRSTTLQTLTYTDGWYNDPERDEGGYSLEFVGGEDAGCNASWRASIDASGGTPGRANSVAGMPADDQAPMITEVDISVFGITLTFDEALVQDQITPALFSADNGLTIFNVVFFDDRQIFLSADVQEGIIYTLTMLSDFSDCGGNFPNDNLVLQLAIPGEPAAGDVVINEVLFNPASGGADFLELFNCSDKVFQIRDWTLTNDQSTTSSGQRTVSVSRLFLPGEYLTFSPDPESIISTFLEVDATLLIDQTLPTMPDDEGNITVASAAGIVLDAFNYTEDFHSTLLSPNDGVSLERLRKQGNTQDGANWYSAASSENFGTPTRPNSQKRDALPVAGETIFSLVNTTFSPNGDSFEDFLELQYQTDRSGFVARIRIMDAQGRLIRTLRQTELLGASGTLLWDGANDDGRKAKAGLYVLLAELVNPDGEVKEEKLVGVLAGER
ncbi:lamin tail domain-containing protein [Neolewinella persica]|uniref:lamin tail domain-containing protein n=1 Tax=Neolewinella persica TaxID=70998 RepID=UPI00038008E5|nr:lamin tail domain-containing protein [Neolewinella persica]